MIPRSRRLMYFSLLELLYKIIYEKIQYTVFESMLYNIEEMLKNIQLLPFIIDIEKHDKYIKIISNLHENDYIIYKSLNDIPKHKHIDINISNNWNRNINKLRFEYEDTKFIYHISPEQYDNIIYKDKIYIPKVEDLFNICEINGNIIDWFNNNKYIF